MFIRDKKKSVHSNLKIAVLYPLHSRKCFESPGNFAFPIDGIFYLRCRSKPISQILFIQSKKQLSTGFTGSAGFLKPKTGNWETILVRFMPKKFVPFRVTYFIGVLFRTNLRALCASASDKSVHIFGRLTMEHG